MKREPAKKRAFEPGFRSVEPSTFGPMQKIIHARAKRISKSSRKPHRVTHTSRTSAAAIANRCARKRSRCKLRCDACVQDVCPIRMCAVRDVVCKIECSLFSSPIVLDQGLIETLRILASTLSCEGDVVRHAPAPWATASLRIGNANGFGISEEEARCCTVRMWHQASRTTRSPDHPAR
jgi:hypothetical protein